VTSEALEKEDGVIVISQEVVTVNEEEVGKTEAIDRL
jgi:hypothetical protein